MTATRADLIRDRLRRASRAFAWMGAVGVARDDVLYLLGVADAAEVLARAIETERDESGGNPLILRTYKVAPALDEFRAALSQVPSTDSPPVESTRVRATGAPRGRGT